MVFILFISNAFSISVEECVINLNKDIGNAKKFVLKDADDKKAFSNEVNLLNSLKPKC